MCMMGVSDAGYHQKEALVAGEMIMIGYKRNNGILPIYWNGGLIR